MGGSAELSLCPSVPYLLAAPAARKAVALESWICSLPGDRAMGGDWGKESGRVICLEEKGPRKDVTGRCRDNKAR